MSSQKTSKVQREGTKTVKFLKHRLALIQSYKDIIETDKKYHSLNVKNPIFNARFANLLIVLAEVYRPTDIQHKKSETKDFNGRVWLYGEEKSIEINRRYNELLSLSFDGININIFRKNKNHFEDFIAFPFVDLSIEGDLICKRFPTVQPYNPKTLRYEHERNPEKIHGLLSSIIDANVNKIGEKLNNFMDDIIRELRSNELHELANEVKKLQKIPWMRD